MPVYHINTYSHSHTYPEKIFSKMDMEQWTGSKSEKECVKAASWYPAYLTYNAEYIMRNTGLDEAQAEIKTAGRNINNLRYADMQSCLTLWDPMDYSLPGSSVHGDSPGKNTGVGCLSLLQGIFPAQGSKPHLLHWQEDSLLLIPQGSRCIS